MTLALLLLPLLTQSAPTAQSRPTPPEEGPTGAFIYYDYPEGGELRGGRIPVDPDNPLHAASGDLVARPSGSPVTTLLLNGPSENRIDLVFVGDGYTAAELGQYAADVDAVWPTFLAEPPLAEYASYFNVFRVDVVSPESGVDNDPTNGIQRATALDMGYWCSGIQRLLCVNPLKANQEANNAPERDVVLALANSGTYGGAGYNSLGTLAGHNSAAIEIALHEFGHSFAGLADEYDYGGPATYTGPEPSEANVTTWNEAEMVSMDRKWARWLDLAGVDLFEGAAYSSFGIFRPTQNSKMRNLGRPFQAVNTERFVRHMYRFVDPIDDATPAGTYALDAQFFVVPLQPLGHDLDVQWFLDRVPIPGANGTTLDAGGLGLARGAWELSVVVADRTPLVRNPALLEKMKERRAWTLLGDGHLRGGTSPEGPSAPRAPLAGGRGHVLELRLDPEDAPRPGARALVALSPQRAALADAGLAAWSASPAVVSLAGTSWVDEEGGVRVSASVPARLAHGGLFARVLWVGPGRELAWSARAVPALPARP